MHDRAAPHDLRDGLRAGAVAALLPLLVWAIHFGFCYAWLSVTCMPGLAAREIAGMPLTVTGLAVVSAACAGILGWLLARAAIVLARTHTLVGMAGGLRFGAGALALVATLWATLPMFFVPACGG